MIVDRRGQTPVSSTRIRRALSPLVQPRSLGAADMARFPVRDRARRRRDARPAPRGSALWHAVQGAAREALVVRDDPDRATE